MKYLMKVGDQLDLQVSYDGGAVDGVTYNAPDGYDNKVSVTSAGIVTALGLGEGVVNVLSGGAIVGTIVFDVLTEAAYVAQQGIRDGSKALAVDADVVPVAPAFALVAGGTIRTGGNYAYPPEYAFDNNDETHWESSQTFASITNWDCFIGKEFSSAKQIKKIVVKWRQVPTEVDVLVVNNSNPWGAETVMTIPVVWSDATAQQYHQAHEIILPAYSAKTAIYLRPKTSTAIPGTYWASHGGTIDRFRVTQLDFYE